MSKPWRLWSKRGLYERIGEITESYEDELRRLRALEWYATDFVLSCPEIPNHPTAARLVRCWVGMVAVVLLVPPLCWWTLT